MPIISVVLPVYNGEKYLKEAIDSILQQTYADFELIIINDGSTDQTENIIESYQDPRINYLKNEHNSGIVVSLNKGLDAAKGKYIARMDADDIADPQRFQKQKVYLDRHPNIGVVGSSMLVFDEYGKEMLFPYAASPNRAKAELFFNSSLGHPTVMLRKECIKGIRYEAEYQGLEDFVMWWRIAQHYDIGSLTEPLLHYRKHSNQITKTRSPEHYARFDQFTLERIGSLLDKPNVEGIKLFGNYCRGEYESFTVDEIRGFIEFLSLLSNANRDKRLFSERDLKTVFGLAVSLVLSKSKQPRKLRRELYVFAWRKDAMDTILLVKLMLHLLREVWCEQRK